MLRRGGIEVVHDRYFDTLLTHVPGRAAEIVAAAREEGVQVRHVDDDHVGLSVGETFDAATFAAVLRAFGVYEEGTPSIGTLETVPKTWPAPRRTSPTRCSPPIAARPRCCATYGGSRRATTPSTAA